MGEGRATVQLELALPRKIVFGPGEFVRLGGLTGALGGSALVCIGRASALRAGRLDRAVALLRYSP